MLEGNQEFRSSGDQEFINSDGDKADSLLLGPQPGVQEIRSFFVQKAGSLTPCPVVLARSSGVS